jgi:hypothetical protein
MAERNLVAVICKYSWVATGLLGLVIGAIAGRSLRDDALGLAVPVPWCWFGKAVADEDGRCMRFVTRAGCDRPQDEFADVVYESSPHPRGAPGIAVDKDDDGFADAYWVFYPTPGYPISCDYDSDGDGDLDSSFWLVEDQVVGHQVHDSEHQWKYEMPRLAEGAHASGGWAPSAEQIPGRVTD